jgi:hypothetical protein
MDVYRIYRTKDILSVSTSEPYVTMKLDPDNVLRCVGTGTSKPEILKATYLGRLGRDLRDDKGREFTELFSGL